MTTQLTFPGFDVSSVASTLAEPAAYRGLHAFHKYWGKKPAEPNRYLIQQLCPKGGLAVDPFLIGHFRSGSGPVEAPVHRRDINPAAVRIA